MISITVPFYPSTTENLWPQQQRLSGEPRLLPLSGCTEGLQHSSWWCQRRSSRDWEIHPPPGSKQSLSATAPLKTIWRGWPSTPRGCHEAPRPLPAEVVERRSSRHPELSWPPSYRKLPPRTVGIGHLSVSGVHAGSLCFHSFFHLVEMRGHLTFLPTVISEEG